MGTLRMPMGQMDARHLAATLGRSGSLGISESSMVAGEMSEAVAVELRGILSAGLGMARARVALSRAMADDGAPATDRFWGFAVFEDDAHAVERLRSSTPEYLAFLARVAADSPTLLLQKMARFQLVLCSNDFDAAFRYIAWASLVECGAAADLASHVGGDLSAVSEFLVGRLTKAWLWPALPVTVHRLGQFGRYIDIESLSDLRSRESDPRLIDIISVAIQEIRNRALD